MTEAELESALARGAWVAAPKPESPLQHAGVASVLIMDQAALNYARKWNLIREDGSLKCIRDRCDGDGVLPTMECRECRHRRVGG